MKKKVKNTEMEKLKKQVEKHKSENKSLKKDKKSLVAKLEAESTSKCKIIHSLNS